MRIPNLRGWIMGSVLAAGMILIPYLYYRYTLEHSKRLRPIVAGRLYRSGCLSADGFRDAFKSHGIKTCITLWDEDPDPNLPKNRFSFERIRESELCKEMGVKYHFIHVQLMSDADVVPGKQKAVEEFLKIMDDESNYPVLFHCKAGLHRTGVLAAIYRMEYDRYSVAEAMNELRANGFGTFTANSANPYIRQYVLPYQPRWRGQPAREVKALPVVNRMNP